MRYLWALLALLALLLGTGSSTRAQERSVAWQAIDTDVAVRADGSLAVTETLTIQFNGGPFTFGFRDISTQRIDDLENITVRADDQPLRFVEGDESDEPNTFTIADEGDDQRIRWTFDPTTDTARTFILSYKVIGAVRRYSTDDELWWSMVFADREQPVERATGRITLPAPVPTSDLIAETPHVEVQPVIDNGVVRFEAADVPAGEELSLRVRFPKGVVGGAAPRWQAALDAQARYDATLRPTVNRGLGALAGVLPLLGGLIGWTWYRRHRDPRPSEPFPGTTSAPPDDLPPALAAKLLGVDRRQALLGTLFDLAERGYLTLHEADKRGGKKRRDQQTKLSLRRIDRAVADLASFEATALHAVFGDNERVELAKRQSTIAKALPRFDDQCKHALVAAGYLKDQPVRTGWIRALAIGLFVVALVGMCPALLLAGRYSWWLPVVCVGAGVAAICSIGATFLVGGLTQRGVDARGRWRAFRSFLQSIKRKQAQPGMFDDLLPYAIALADARKLTTAYRNTGTTLPTWYVFSDGQRSHSSDRSFDERSGDLATAIETTESEAGGSGGSWNTSGGSRSSSNSSSGSGSSWSSGGGSGGSWGGGSSGGGGGGFG